MRLNLNPSRALCQRLAHIPTWFHDKQTNDKPTPPAILDKRMVKHQNAAQGQYLVQWQEFSLEEATWAPTALMEQHPQFAAQQFEICMYNS